MPHACMGLLANGVTTPRLDANVFPSRTRAPWPLGSSGNSDSSGSSGRSTHGVFPCLLKPAMAPWKWDVLRCERSTDEELT